MMIHAEILAVALPIALACALLGNFLVLRRLALLSDAISHVVLLGIVIGFFAAGTLHSPWLVIGAALSGVATVALIELLHRTRRFQGDATIGLVFPAFFSLAVILISRYAGQVHLDTDAVLLGELAFAPLTRFRPGGYDLGPASAWWGMGILAANAVFVALFYKELKLACFDEQLAAASGARPRLLHYALMTAVALTAVVAFDAVGSVLVVAFMIVPAAAALLFSRSLGAMIGLSAVFAAAGTTMGYGVAALLDASIAGSMAAVFGMLFGAAVLTAPGRGVIPAARRRARQKRDFAELMLLIHLENHEGSPAEADECRAAHLEEHLKWPAPFAREVVERARKRGLLREEQGTLRLTQSGRDAARGQCVPA